MAEAGEKFVADGAGGVGDLVDVDMGAEQLHHVAAPRRADAGDVDGDEVHRDAADQAARWPMTKRRAPGCPSRDPAARR